MKRATVISLFILTLAMPAMATDDAMVRASRFDEALVTDRPDAAEASVTVGANRFQVETGIGYTYDKSEAVTTKTFGMPTLLRYGIIDAVEARVEGEIFNHHLAPDAAAQTGFTDIAFGMKLHVTNGGGLIPSFGVLANLSAPTGNEEFSSNGWEPTLKFLADWELPAGFGLGTNIGFDVPARLVIGEQFSRFLYAAALGRGIPGVEERLRIFIESAGAVAMQEGKPVEHQLDTGFAVLLTPDMQLDAVVQIGLTDASPDLATGLGFSWRL